VYYAELNRQALELAENLSPTASNIARIGAKTSPEAARWAFNQWELRTRAKAKFSRASEMLFVREALEQATHERVAEYHASLFPAGALVADLTCGVGGDLIALAARGPAIGFELDEDRAECARFNSNAEVRLEDSLTAEWNWDYAIADPARRVGGRRTLDPDQFEPNPQILADKMATLKLGLIKLSPLLPDSFLTSLGPGLEFVSYGGECREALVHCGQEANPGVRAVHVETGEKLSAGEAPDQVDQPESYLYEADPALIRAHALGALGLKVLGESNGYLTGANLELSPWCKTYKVLDHGSFDPKRVRTLVPGGVSAAKARAKGVDVPRIEKTLRRDSQGPVIALYEVGRSVRFVLLSVVE
jgi:hypothetical protein